MSREIKFRVWSESDKEYRTDCSVHKLFTSKTGTPATIYNDEGDCFLFEQYTGLKDKNGKEIYEGDILETCCGKAEVYFDDELLMYKIRVTHGGTMPLVSKKSKRHFDYKIIGNIHENPELLGGEE